MINDIVRQRHAVTPDPALKLTRYFKTTAQFWLYAQSSFDLMQTESDVGRKIEKEIYPMTQAA